MGRKRNNLSKSINISESRQESFQGIWIPKEIYLDEKLNMMEKIILCEIISLSELGNGCIAGNKHFADLIGMSERRTQEYIQHLEELEYIEREYIYKDNSKEIQKRIIIPTNRWCEISHGGGARNRADKKTVFKENKNNNHSNRSFHKEHRDFHSFYLDLEKQVFRVCKSLGMDDINSKYMYNFIENYYDMYLSYMAEVHPFLKDDVLEECIDRIRSSEIFCYDLDDDYSYILERYFETDFRVATDYRLPHFLSDGITEILDYQIVI